MPLYEYSCRDCGHAFEILVSAKVVQTVQCPSCESEKVEQLIGLPAAGRVAHEQSTTNCRGDGPPCGAPRCGRKG